MSGELAAIERVLMHGKSTVQRNKTWDRIHAETGAGVVIGRKLHLTPEDRQRLREYAQATYMFDPVYDSRAGGRMELAQLDVSEKLSSGSVFGNLVVMATVGKALLGVNGYSVQTPAGSVLSVLPEAIDTAVIRNQALIVVENGAIMSAASNVVLPIECANAVLVYRGHGANARAVRNLVEEQPESRLYYFFDFDPAGLAMAIQHGRGRLLVPAEWDQLSEGSGANQASVHLNQHTALSRLRSMAVKHGKVLVERMAAQHIAVMQEHIVARRMPLTAYDVRDMTKSSTHVSQ